LLSIFLVLLNLDDNGYTDSIEINASSNPLDPKSTPVSVSGGGDGTRDGSSTITPVSSDSGGGGNCFIATAVYGSLMEPHVRILRDFRYRFLIGNILGDSFVRLYYTYSPPIADFISKHDNLRAMVHISLLPVVGVSRVALKLGPISTMAIIRNFKTLELT